MASIIWKVPFYIDMTGTQSAVVQIKRVGKCEYIEDMLIKCMYKYKRFFFERVKVN
jgi:hypothetical protein